MDISRPTLSRVDDYLLGGGRSWRLDRQLAQAIIVAAPGYQEYCVAAHAFVRRAALHLLDLGVTQFVHVGCGMPTTVNLHDLVTGLAPDAVVVYVDDDVVDCEVRRPELHGARHLAVLEVPDLGDAEHIVSEVTLAADIDWAAPVAVIIHSALTRLGDAVCASLLDGLRALLPGGSAVALAHPSRALLAPVTHPTAAVLRDKLTAAGLTLTGRTRGQLLDLIAPWTLAADGVVPVRCWRSDGCETQLRFDDSVGYAALATTPRP